MCAEKIRSDPEKYCEAILGKPNEEYAQWITNPFNWGGEIELSILAEHFALELCVVSMEAFWILPFPFGDKGRAYLLYTGQHYDPLVGVPNEDSPIADETRLFAVGDTTLEPQALDCARLHARVAAERASQRTVKKIKCGGCGAVVEDADAFQAHCGEVEHDDDFCFDCTEVEVVEAGGDPVPEGRIDLTSPDVVTFYNVPTASFSNLYPAPFKVGEVTFPTAEHFILARQFPGSAEAVLGAPTEQLAQLASTLVGESEGWAAGGLREASLREALEAKFSAHEVLKAELKATGAKTLVLVDSDKWAGMSAAGGIPTGKNRVGAALMQVRAVL